MGKSAALRGAGSLLVLTALHSAQSSVSCFSPGVAVNYRWESIGGLLTEPGEVSQAPWAFGGKTDETRGLRGA